MPSAIHAASRWLVVFGLVSVVIHSTTVDVRVTGSAPSTGSGQAPSTGSGQANIIYIDWENDLVVVVRWIRQAAFNDVIGQVLGSLPASAR